MTATEPACPIPMSPFGRRCWDLGRQAVLSAGIRPRHIMWDADETLWDWLMSARRVVSRMPILALRRSLAHREWVRVRAGIFEFIWGMHEAALDLDDESPWMRIWTNGYPWRIQAIGAAIPGLATLLGIDDASDAQAWARCPNIFFRGDFVRAAGHLIDAESREAVMGTMPDAARRTLQRQLDGPHPLDSNLKLPELASFPSPEEPEVPVKSGFSEIEWLVDDRGRNVERFMASGRRGVRVVSHAPSAFRGRVPNTTWGGPFRALRRMATQVSVEVAEALLALADATPPASADARSDRAVPDGYPWIEHTVDVPNDALRAQWLEPMRRLRADAPAAMRRRDDPGW